MVEVVVVVFVPVFVVIDVGGRSDGDCVGGSDSSSIGGDRDGCVSISPSHRTWNPLA
jgi:hypothetical protein